MKAEYNTGKKKLMEFLLNCLFQNFHFYGLHLRIIVLKSDVIPGNSKSVYDGAVCFLYKLKIILDRINIQHLKKKHKVV